MTTITYAQIEYGERLASIAQAYRKLGYSVKETPTTADLPDFLQQFQPDLIAQKPGENLVVELKKRVHSRPLSYWLVLESALEKHTDWKLQLIDAGSLDMDLAPDSEPSKAEEINDRIANAEQLLENGQPDLSVVVGFGALEASMRAIVSSNRLPWDRTNTLTLIAALLDESYLTADEVDVVRKVMEKRNSIVHGFSGNIIDEQEIRNLLEIAKDLTAQI